MSVFHLYLNLTCRVPAIGARSWLARWAGLVLMLMFCLPVQAQPIAADNTSPSENAPASIAADSALVRALAEGGMVRSQALNALIETPPEGASEVLHALNRERLFVQSAPNARLAIALDDGQLLELSSERMIGHADDSGWEKINLNNAIRIKLRPRIDILNLGAADAQIRKEAAHDLLTARLTPAFVLEIRNLIPTLPKDAAVETLKQLIASVDLNDTEPSVRLNAITELASTLSPEVRAKLANLVEEDADAGVRSAAKRALSAMDERIAAWGFAQNLVFGLSLGSVLLLSAIGLAITFGVMGVINMAHGEMMMIGAYTTWVLQQILPEQTTLALLLAIPSAFLAAGLMGIAIERGLIRFLYGRPLETLLATFGLSLILQQAARLIFSPLNRAVTLPEFMSNSWVLNPVFAITYNRLYILIFSLTVFFALLLLLKRSTFGLRMRAVAQNRQMARACGVRSGWIDALTFGLGSGIAGVAGVALALITNVGPNLGQDYIIDAFMVVVLGGVGNLWGTLVASMGIGIMNKFLEPYAGAVLAKVVVLVVVILVIQKRPRGLFPQKGRAAEE